MFTSRCNFDKTGKRHQPQLLLMGLFKGKPRNLYMCVLFFNQCFAGKEFSFLISK